MATIDVGSAAVLGNQSNPIYPGGYTLINQDNAANATGILQTFEIYLRNGASNATIGTFSNPSGLNYANRDSVNVGTISSSSKQTFSGLSCDVATGDFIGIYDSSGRVEATSSGVGRAILSGNQFGAGEQTFFTGGAYTISLWGEGISTPDAPTNVQATDGTHTDKVTITWTKSTGATAYQVYRNGSAVSAVLGDVATWDDTTAAAPSITGGTAAASDGTSEDYVTLSLSGESANNGTSYTYTVKAYNAAGWSSASAGNTGYRGVGSLSRQWYRSAGDSDASYSVLSGATTDPYNDTTAPEDGSGRYYKCYLTATGASSVYSSANRGYRVVPPIIINGDISVGASVSFGQERTQQFDVPAACAPSFAQSRTQQFDVPATASAAFDLTREQVLDIVAEAQVGLIGGPEIAWSGSIQAGVVVAFVQERTAAFAAVADAVVAFEQARTQPAFDVAAGGAVEFDQERAMTFDATVEVYAAFEVAREQAFDVVVDAAPVFDQERTQPGFDVAAVCSVEFGQSREQAFDVVVDAAPVFDQERTQPGFDVAAVCSVEFGQSREQAFDVVAEALLSATWFKRITALIFKTRTAPSMTVKDAPSAATKTFPQTS